MKRRVQILAVATSMGLGAVGLTAPASVYADGGGDCHPERLEVPEGTTSSWVATGSPDGSVLAGYASDAAGEAMIIWRDGAPDVLDVDLRNPNVAAVNNDGVAVGFGFNADNDRVSFRHEAGDLTWLGTPDGMDGTVTDINSSGDIVGYGVQPGVTQPLRWDADNPEQAEILPNDGGGSADGINDAGEVVGYSGWPGTPDGIDASIWHPDGSRAALPVLEGHSNGVAEHISGNQAGGFFDSGGEEGKQVRWNLEDGTVTELSDSLYGTYAINAAGELAAQTVDGHAAIVRGERVIELPHAGGDSATAYALSDDGVAAGTAEFADGTSHAVSWSGC